MIPPESSLQQSGSAVRAAPPQPAVVKAAIAECRKTNPHLLSRSHAAQEAEFLRAMQLPNSLSSPLAHEYEAGMGARMAAHQSANAAETQLGELRQMVRELDRMWLH